MRRVASTLVHSLRDQIRGVRYSVRAEAQTPGSIFPWLHQATDFGPLSVIRTPALRVADGIFTQVEHAATDLLDRVDTRAPVAFPCAVDAYQAGDTGSGSVDFSGTIHTELTRLLRSYGARNMLVSEYALDTAWSKVLGRHGDAAWPAGSRRRDRAMRVLISAAIACEFARARPIQRIDLIEKSASAPRHLMLAPNLYCGLVIGLATAIASVVEADRRAEPGAMLESANATVDARFDRFKRAFDSKTDARALAVEFEAVLPFLP